MRKLMPAFVLLVVLLSLLGSPAFAAARPPAVATRTGQGPAVPPELAQAGVSSSAWQHMVDQIRVDQQRAACTDCATALDLTGQATLTAADGSAYDLFGYSVAISGDTVIVGAVYHDVAGNEDRGAAYIFGRNQGGADQWGQVARLTAADGSAYDEFGWSVAISGDTALVGAPSGDVGSNTNQGSAYVFGRNQDGTDHWGQVARLTAADGSAYDLFGCSVAISGDTALVGARSDDVGSNTNQGSAYVFARNQGGADQWGQVAHLTAADGTVGDNFGHSVAISGDTALVGAPFDDVGAHRNQGSAYIFARNQGGADHWGQVAHLTAADGSAYDEFGSSVAISGDTALVGADYDNVAGNEGQGSAYVFGRNQGGADQWGQVAHLTAADGSAADLFGSSVAISGDTALVGAPYDDVGSNLDQGSAYVFGRNQGGTDHWGQVAHLTAADGGAYDYFGCSVAISGDTLIVGAAWADVGSNREQGVAYVFGQASTSDLAVTKTVEPALVLAPGVLTYTLAYASNGPAGPVDVWITDTLPAGTAFGGLLSAPPAWSGPTVNGQTLGWYAPLLAADDSGTIVFTATVGSAAVSPDWLLTNTATITTTTDSTPDNNLSAATAILQGLQIAKSHYPATVTAAWDFWMYIDLTNTATSPATDVVVTDILPVGVAAYSVQPGQGAAFDGVNTVVWNLPSIGPNSTVRLSIKARTYSTQAGNCLTNLAVADSAQAAPPVSAQDTFCVLNGELAYPTPVPTATPTPVPPGTTVALKKGGPGNSLDTYIYRNQPFSNYWLEPLLKVGYKQTNASLIQFDLSPIPAGATVDEAWLEVFATGWSGPGADMVIGAYAISNTVQISQTTWVSPELGLTWGLGGANDLVVDRRPRPESTVTTHGPLVWYRFDLKNLTAQWLSGETSNNGLLLRCDSCRAQDNQTQLVTTIPGNLCTYTFFFASGEYSDQTRWPRLMVRYH